MMIFNTWKQHIYYLNFEENRYLAELRDALLPELMSGKIDVKQYINGRKDKTMLEKIKNICEKRSLNINAENSALNGTDETENGVNVVTNVKCLKRDLRRWLREYEG